MYYFTAQFIANNIDKKHISKHIVSMSNKLHIEEYGNIMIFVCHFSKSDKIINTVLSRALDTLNNVKPFDFSVPDRILDITNENIDKILLSKPVGEESEVKELRTQDLAERDDREIRNSSANDTESDSWDENETEDKRVSDIISALKIIEVLGQILRNYPGDISGAKKQEVIREVNYLAMRTFQVFIDIFGFMELDMLNNLADNIKQEDGTLTEGAIAYKVKGLFYSLLVHLARVIVNKVASSISSIHNLTAAEEELSQTEENLSLAMILIETKLHVTVNPQYDEIIRLNKYLKSKKLDFASQILRKIVANHLRHCHCGAKIRDSLCAEFDLHKRLTVENQI